MMDLLCCFERRKTAERANRGNQKKSKKDGKKEKPKKGGRKEQSIPGAVAIAEICKVEERGNEIIEEARQRRDDLLDRAEAEAKAEIAMFRKKMEKDFAAKQAQNELEDKQFKRKLSKETWAKLDKLDEQLRRKRGKVVAMVVQKVCDFPPPRQMPHHNAMLRIRLGRDLSHSSTGAALSRRSTRSGFDG